MGKIQNEVAARHLVQYQAERDLLVPFLASFDVNWASRIRKKGTQFSAYFLDPEQTIKDQFGIENEVLLIFSDFDQVQPRTMQAIDDFMRQSPARGRIDPTTVFLVAPDPSLREWVDSYSALNPQFRVTIAITRSELEGSRADTWFIRRALSEQLYSRDLFNDQLPLRNDTFFFGRTSIAAELVTSLKLGQNRGIFGLRKTGKTSLLFKIKRMAQSDGIEALYFDCKDPSIRSLSWEEFLEDIIVEIEKASGRKAPKSGHVSRRFRKIVADACGKKKLALLFDEIEWISPVAVLDKHWHKDFVPFWQTMWATQSECRDLALIIAGVNPTVTELAEVQEVQNPLFGIISPTFLTGFAESELRQMLGKFGKRMGLKFDHETSLYMFERYGGHPLLTRMAASFVNTKARDEGLVRPIKVTKAQLQLSEIERDAEVLYYCPHIVSELSKFYPDEYQMLEWLVTGNEADFYEFAEKGAAIRHLLSYGVIEKQSNGQYKIAIPVLGRYLLSEGAKNKEDWSPFYVVDDELRSAWLRNRIERIATDIRRLDRLGTQKGKPDLFGTNGFPEAEKFFQIELVHDRRSLENFLNQVNKCFVGGVSPLHT